MRRMGVGLGIDRDRNALWFEASYSVPYLYFERFLVEVDRFGSKLHANGRVVLLLESGVCKLEDHAGLPDIWLFFFRFYQTAWWELRKSMQSAKLKIYSQARNERYISTKYCVVHLAKANNWSLVSDRGEMSACRERWIPESPIIINLKR